MRFRAVILLICLCSWLVGCAAYKDMKEGFAEMQYPGSKAPARSQKAPKR